jgi:hypothetical protein
MLMLLDAVSADKTAEHSDVPVLRGLSILDRFLVVWIVLAMAIGILLGNFVDSVGPALQKGKFVGVSVPIGKFDLLMKESTSLQMSKLLSDSLNMASRGTSCNDVPNPLQSPLRNTPSPPTPQSPLDPNRSFLRAELDPSTAPNGRSSMGFSP